MICVSPPGHREAYGPQTWALIREAYLAGTPAPHLSRTFGPHVDTIRKRAMREGWTRTAHAAAQGRANSDPPAADLPASANPGPSRADPVRVALDRAAVLLAAGRGAEAAATLKAAEALRRLQAELGSETAGKVDERRSEISAAEKADREVTAWEQVREMIEERADGLARGLLKFRFPSVPVVHSPFVLHWRAMHLGAEAARADYDHAMHAGWARQVYTSEGVLRPLADLLADERRRLWESCSRLDDGRTLSQRPDPLHPAPDKAPPAWTQSIIREL